MGILVIGAVLTLVGNLLADLFYSLADPRIRVAG
jgi:peptide/nickel transport system permease protein